MRPTPIGRRTTCFAALFCLATALPARADDFRLTIGNPVAAMAPATTPGTSSAPPMKKLMAAAIFVVRVDGAADPGQARITATAEGLVNGVRRSEPIVLGATSAAGVYAVNRGAWPDGTWVVNLVATYRDLKAGAVVPIAGAGFVREASQFFPRPATTGEIDAALKAHLARTPAR